MTPTNTILFRLLTALTGAMSVISLITHTYDVGLINTLGLVVDYYRSIADFVFGLIPKLFNWDPPQRLDDIWALSFVGVSAYLRVPNIEQSRAFRGRYDGPLPIHVKILMFVFFGFTGIGAIFLMTGFVIFTFFLDFYEEKLDLMQECQKNLFLIAGVTLIFFAINAFAPSF